MPDLIITPGSGKLEFVDSSAQVTRRHSFTLDANNGIVLDSPFSASSVTAPLNVINVTAASSNVSYPFIFADSGETGPKSLLMDSAGGTYNPSTNTATIDITGNSATTTLASNSTQLNGQAASYYTNISARLGYTPVNQAGDTISGNLTVNGNFTLLGNANFFSASNIYITSSVVQIDDNIITLNAFSPYLRYAGIEMYDSGSGTLSSILWDSQGDYFFLTGSGINSKIIGGPDQQGNLTSGKIPKATAGNILGDSIITDNGSSVSIAGTISASSFTGSGLILTNTNTVDSAPFFTLNGATNTERAIIIQDAGTNKWWFGRDNNGTVQTGIGFYNYGTSNFEFYITDAGTAVFRNAINGSISGNAATATTLQTARNIGGVSFNGSADINLPGVNTAGNQNTTGNAATATTASYANALNAANQYTVSGITGSLFGTSSWATNAVTALNGGVTSVSAGTGISVNSTTGAVTVTNSSPNATHTGEVTGATALTISSSAITTTKIADGAVTNAKLTNSSVTIGSTAVSLGATVATFAGLTSVTSTTFVGALTGNASTATTLQTARNIGGVSFNGSADINLPGVNTAGNQNTSGNAATATTASYANALNPANNYTVNSLTEGGYLAYPLREYVINLSSQSTASFYPIAIDNPPGTDGTWHHSFSIDEVNQSGAAAYNVHSMYGEVRGQGWTDQPYFHRIFHNFYDSNERSLLGIWRPTQNWYGVVIYVRGGKNYYVRTTSRSAVGYSSAWTVGNSVFAIKNVAGADVSGTSANIAEMLNFVNNPSGFYHSDNAYVGTNQVVHLGTTSAPSLSIGGSAASCTGNAATATVLQNARNIGGVSFNGSADINLPGVNTAGNQNTSGNAATATTASYANALNAANNYTAVQFVTTGKLEAAGNVIAGGQFSGAGTGLTGTAAGLSIGGNAATATTLQTARNIGGVSFNGSADINLPGVNTAGNQNTSGNAATATNSTQLGGVTKVQLFNNTGNNHPTYTTFGALPDFGFYFMQGQNAADAPAGQPANQYYVISMGLGNDYAYSAYVNQIAFPRINVGGGNNYLWIRQKESNTWGSWGKVYAGYADSAAIWTTARTLTIGSTGKSVNGSADVSWTLAELGAAATNQTMYIGTTAVAINRTSSALSLTGVSIDGNAATATTATTANALNTSNSYTVTNLIASGYLQSTVGYLRTDDSNGIEVLTTLNAAQAINVKGILIGSSYDTTAPQNEIRTSANQSLNLNARGTGDITLSTADGERVRLLNGGNVGIGTSNPGRKLDVEGIVRTRGASGTGGFEIGAATTGTAKWRIEWDSASDSLDFNWVG